MVFNRACAKITLQTLAVTFALVSGPVAAAQTTARAFPHWLKPVATALCQHSEPSRAILRTLLRSYGLKTGPLEGSDSGPGGLHAKTRLGTAQDIVIRLLRPGTAQRQLQLIFNQTSDAGSLHMMLRLTGNECSVALARALVRDSARIPVKLLHFKRDLSSPVRNEALNPPVPTGSDPGGVAVALIDTGIAYTVPVFAKRLARDNAGRILGRDFADGDNRPYDLDPSTPPLFPRRHGSAVASIIIREAPDARLIPYRYPAKNFAVFATMIDAIARSPARIVAMPLGGNAEHQWRAFASKARQHPEILFIVSAGNNARDIAHRPVYPASFTIDNMLVVTSSDGFGRLAEGSNWSETRVDISTPGERINVIDHRGARGKASGSSYAVPRIAALAARLAARNPEWTARQIKAAIIALAAPVPGRTIKSTRYGWIANPAIE